MPSKHACELKLEEEAYRLQLIMMNRLSFQEGSRSMRSLVRACMIN